MYHFNELLKSLYWDCITSFPIQQQPTIINVDLIKCYWIFDSAFINTKCFRILYGRFRVCDIRKSLPWRTYTRACITLHTDELAHISKSYLWKPHWKILNIIEEILIGNNILKKSNIFYSDYGIIYPDGTIPM